MNPYSPVSKKCGLVLLHGLFRTRRSMRKLAWEGAKRGYMVLNLGYPSRRFCLNDLSEEVFTKIQDWQKKTDVEELHFITHSMGGIILRLIAPEVSSLAACRAVMLGPPNQGSELADYLGDRRWYQWLNGPAGMELGTFSSLLAETKAAKCMPIAIIAGSRSTDPLGSAILPQPNDGRVTVQRTKLEGMKDHLVLPVTHTFMMNDDKVIDASFRFLAELRF